MLEMQYFVLKPKSKHAGDRWATASRRAMKTFAREIADVDIELAVALDAWVECELQALRKMEQTAERTAEKLP